MKHVDEIFEFLGYGIHPSRCGLKIIRFQGKAPIVILTDIGMGTSVTNAIEDIATAVYKAYFTADTPPESIVWVEHYPPRGKGQNSLDKETWDRVTLQWHPERPIWQQGRVVGNGSFYDPDWARITEEEAYGAVYV